MQDIEEIYKQYFKIVYKYLFCLTHNSDISEELAQDTFCKAVEKIHTFRGDCKISVWLCQIAKNSWYNYCKKTKKIMTYEEAFLDFQSSENIENTVILNEEKDLLYKKIHNLDEPTKEVMYLRLTGELTFKEIAIIMNKTENWARVTFYRGKNKIKEVDENG